MFRWLSSAGIRTECLSTASQIVGPLIDSSVTARRFVDVFEEVCCGWNAVISSSDVWNAETNAVKCSEHPRASKKFKMVQTTLLHDRPVDTIWPRQLWESACYSESRKETIPGTWIERSAMMHQFRETIMLPNRQGSLPGCTGCITVLSVPRCMRSTAAHSRVTSPAVSFIWLFRVVGRVLLEDWEGNVIFDRRFIKFEPDTYLYVAYREFTFIP
jgi:hypothetical protein